MCMCWYQGSSEEESEATQAEEIASTKAQRSVLEKLPIIQTSIIIQKRGEVKVAWLR